jgi:hypothetical protein
MDEVTEVSSRASLRAVVQPARHSLKVFRIYNLGMRDRGNLYLGLRDWHKMLGLEELRLLLLLLNKLLLLLQLDLLLLLLLEKKSSLFLLVLRRVISD